MLLSTCREKKGKKGKSAGIYVIEICRVSFLILQAKIPSSCCKGLKNFPILKHKIHNNQLNN